MRTRARWALGALVALALVTATAGPAGAAAIWSTAGTMNAHRADALAVVLPNGKVLVAGGNTGTASLASAQLYTPSATGGAGTWSSAGSMSVARFGAVAGLLQDGRVLVAGGWNETDGFLDSADLYDPTANTWTPVPGTMTDARIFPTVAALPNGDILIAGGSDASCTPLSSAELYDPTANAFSPAEPMINNRIFGVMSLLQTGDVLVAGGANYYPGCPTAGPAAFPSRPFATSAWARPGQTRKNVIRKAAEIYDPTANTWTAAASMATARVVAGGVRLFNGKVLEAGGVGATFTLLSSAEQYNATSNTWSSAGSFATARDGFGLMVLDSGLVLMAGGFDTNGTLLASANLYTPSSSGTGSWATTASMSVGRPGAATAVMSNGRGLMAGGWANSFESSARKGAEQYTPSPNQVENISPSFGPVSSTLTVSGSGFGASEALKIFHGSTLLATITAGPAGDFSTTVTIPANSTLQYHVIKTVGQTTKRTAQQWWLTTG